LPFVHQNAPIYLAGHARPGPTFEDDRRLHAVARILLGEVIHNLQVSWVKMGVEACQVILNGGANDFGGTLMEETISRMAGATWGIAMEVGEIEDAVRAIDRIPVERTTAYGRVRRNGFGGRLIVEPVIRSGAASHAEDRRATRTDKVPSTI
jgi:FO synthase